VNEIETGTVAGKKAVLMETLASGFNIIQLQPFLLNTRIRRDDWYGLVVKERSLGRFPTLHLVFWAFRASNEVWTYTVVRIGCRRIEWLEIDWCSMFILC
jgi:hypothetical protein